MREARWWVRFVENVGIVKDNTLDEREPGIADAEEVDQAQQIARVLGHVDRDSVVQLWQQQLERTLVNKSEVALIRFPQLAEVSRLTYGGAD